VLGQYLQTASVILHFDRDGGFVTGDHDGGSAVPVQDRVGGYFAERDRELLDSVRVKACHGSGVGQEPSSPDKVTRPVHAQGGHDG
jgi:hypothetical protein